MVTSESWCPYEDKIMVAKYVPTAEGISCDQPSGACPVSAIFFVLYCITEHCQWPVLAAAASGIPCCPSNLHSGLSPHKSHHHSTAGPLANTRARRYTSRCLVFGVVPTSVCFTDLM